MLNIFSIERNEKLKGSKYYNKIKKTVNNLECIKPYLMPSKEIVGKFRNIQNVYLIPDNIYNELNNNGTIENWKGILSSNSSRVYEKMKIKDEIRNYAVSVKWNPNLDIQGKELFYLGSNTFRTRYLYEFDKETKTGLGLIINNMQSVGYFDE